jgi:hypothetical protein
MPCAAASWFRSTNKAYYILPTTVLSYAYGDERQRGRATEGVGDPRGRRIRGRTPGTHPRRYGRQRCPVWTASRSRAPSFAGAPQCGEPGRCPPPPELVLGHVGFGVLDGESGDETRTCGPWTMFAAMRPNRGRLRRSHLNCASRAMRFQPRRCPQSPCRCYSRPMCHEATRRQAGSRAWGTAFRGGKAR